MGGQCNDGLKMAIHVNGGKGSQNGKLGHSTVRVMKGRLNMSCFRGHVIVRLVNRRRACARVILNVRSFTHNFGLLVDGGSVTAAIIL